MTITSTMITGTSSMLTTSTLTRMTIMATKTAMHIRATDMITAMTTACCGSRRPGAWPWRWPSP